MADLIRNVVRFKPKNPGGPSAPAGAPAELPVEPINAELKEHAVSTKWRYRAAIAVLHEWAHRFNKEFQLGLETPAIAIDRLPVRTYGTYRLGRNGFGVRHQITLNERYLDRPLAEQLQTLLHEQLHQWEEQWAKGKRKAGKNGYHTNGFRVMAARFGVIVNDRGHHLGVEPGPFTALLDRYGVNTKVLPLATEHPPITMRPRGRSKMKRWLCSPRCPGSSTVRAVRLKAQCSVCGLEFVSEEDGGYV